MRGDFTNDTKTRLVIVKPRARDGNVYKVWIGKKLEQDELCFALSVVLRIRSE